MLKLLFLLCFSYIVKDSNGAVNSDLTNKPADVMFAIPIASDSSLVCTCTQKANVEDNRNSDLVQKIGATKARFEAVYNEVVRRIEHFYLPEYNNLLGHKNDLTSATYDIFEEEMPRMFAHDKEANEICGSLASKARGVRRNSKITECSYLDEKARTDLPYKHKKIYHDVVNKLMRLSTEAYNCDDEECAEVKESLDKLDVDEKLRQITAVLHFSIDDLFTYDEELGKCFEFVETRQKYKNDLKNAVDNVLNCLEENRHKNNSSSRNAPTVMDSIKPLESNVPIAHGEHDSYSDVVLKVNATKARLQAEWRKLWEQSKNLYEKQQKDVNEAVHHLVSKMTNVFKQENDTMKDYYKERVNTTDCFLPIENLNQQISHHDSRATKCQLFSVVDANKFENVGLVYTPLRENLSTLDSAAFTCGKNTTCGGEIEKKLNEFEPEFEKLSEQLTLFIAELNSKTESFQNCLKLDTTLQKYKVDVKKGFDDMKNCVDRTNQENL